MDAIKNYLESMFMNLPNTPEVQKAKRELGQMMEDKYNELISEGKAQNEAVGIVISEFGNLDEIADELGIGAIMEVPAVSDRRMISLAEAREFIDDKAKQAYMVALGGRRKCGGGARRADAVCHDRSRGGNVHPVWLHDAQMGIHEA